MLRCPHQWSIRTPNTPPPNLHFSLYIYLSFIFFLLILPLLVLNLKYAVQSWLPLEYTSMKNERLLFILEKTRDGEDLIQVFNYDTNSFNNIRHSEFYELLKNSSLKIKVYRVERDGVIQALAQVSFPKSSAIETAFLQT